MCNFAHQLFDMNSYKFDINALRNPEAEVHFKIGDDFFEQKPYSPVQKGQLDAYITITKKEKEFNVQVALRGSVLTTCTRCMGDLNYDIDSSNEVAVKLVESHREDDDYIYVAKDDELDLEPLIYDVIILSIPERHVHADGECNAEMESQLKQYLIN